MPNLLNRSKLINLSRINLNKDRLVFSLSVNRLKSLTMYKSPIAVILGLGINGLGIIRSLSEESIKTIGFYHDHKEIGRYSKYCIPIKCPHINEGEKLLYFLIDFGSKLKRKAVLFTYSRSNPTFFNVFIIFIGFVSFTINLVPFL